jgi:hypothetical protein
MTNFDFNDVERYLRDGGKPEDIANAFAEKLNSIIKVIDNEDNFNDSRDALVDAWNEYIQNYFNRYKLPDGTLIEDWYINIDDIDVITDTLVKVIPLFYKYMNFVEDVSQSVKKSNTVIKSKTNNTINDFFNKYHI